MKKWRVFTKPGLGMCIDDLFCADAGSR